MKDLKVRDVMSADPTTLKRNDKLTLADDIMLLGRIRHLPVVDDDGQRLVGIVSQRDLFRSALAQALGYGKHAQRKILETLSVKDVMTNDVVTARPDTPLIEAAPIVQRAEDRVPSGCRRRAPGRHPDRGRLCRPDRAPRQLRSQRSNEKRKTNYELPPARRLASTARDSYPRRALAG